MAEKKKQGIPAAPEGVAEANLPAETAAEPPVAEGGDMAEPVAAPSGDAEGVVGILSPKQARAVIEAVLFASEEPLAASRIREVVPELGDINLAKVVAEINRAYEKAERPFRIENVAGGWLMYTHPEYAGYIERLYARRQANRLSAKALETLAIVAYKQPVTRLEIEEIRGVNVDGVMKTLLLRNLITIAGSAETVGSPFLYKTTKSFLEYFGLRSLKDLPRLKELDEVIESDPDLREQVGEEILRELSPDTLGMDEHLLRQDAEESDSEPETGAIDAEGVRSAETAVDNPVDGDTVTENSDGAAADAADQSAK